MWLLVSQEKVVAFLQSEASRTCQASVVVDQKNLQTSFDLQKIVENEE